ncbi:MAG TPA: hypothetical protein ENJ26_01890 [Rhodobacteraceae bacterium]|nr:hypothetical protein [Paracoccaceae bacterium]
MNLRQLFLDNLASFVIGTVLLGTAFDFIRRGWNWLLTHEYRGWKLTVIPPAGSGREGYEHALLWEEVRRFKESPFENRKFIQSVCTSEGVRIKAGQVAVDDPHGWVYRNDREKRYVVDFTRMPDDIIQGGEKAKTGNRQEGNAS